jgi:hypothetical protein
MSWQLVRVTRINISLKIFFSETIIPRKLIFGRNVPWVGLIIICSNGSEIPNVFRTGSEKPQKLTKSSSPELQVPQVNKKQFYNL